MKLALAGIGKIAQDQHVPALSASNDFDLVATLSRAGSVNGTPAFTDMNTMLEAHPEIDVISLCLPPVPRFAYAKAALEAGRHVMLEKPPGATLAEVHALEGLARENGLVLFATWHSRMARGVAAAKAALSGKTVQSGTITWKEDVRRWHPDQDWVFEPGGMGILDPGINALSILTEILPKPVHLEKATLFTPENRQTPIACRLEFTSQIEAEFDWRQEGQQTWEMTFRTEEGDVLHLLEGGAQSVLNDVYLPQTDLEEYPALYARMADLVRSGTSDVDLTPMVHVSDAMTLGQRVSVEPFHF